MKYKSDEGSAQENMRKKLASGFVQFLLLMGILSLAFSVRSVKASGNLIVIRSDGAVVPSGTPLIKTGNYTYAFTDSISNTTIIVQRSNITIDGNGYALQAIGGSIVSGFSITTGDYGTPIAHNVTIENLSIRGFYYGVYLNSTRNNVFSGNSLINNKRGFWLEQSSHNTITGNSITSNDDIGVMLSDSTGNNISGNTFLKNDFGVAAQGSPDNVISKNYMKDNGVGVSLGSYSWNTVINNTFVNDGLFVQNSAGCTVENNTINGKPLIYLEGISDWVVEENAGQVLIVSCNNITIRNLVMSNTYCGIVLDSTDHIVVTHNNLTANWMGIWDTTSANTSIIGNRIVGNGGGGGIVFSSTHGGNTVSGNNVTNCGPGNGGIFIVGFSFTDTSPELPSTIIGNNITNNRDGIIDWFGIHWSIIGNNIIGSNDTGIWISDGVPRGVITDVIVYHNNFINNAPPRIFYQPTIAWDNGYPSGGNYWSDYAGGDTNYDGIGDTLYAINGGYADRYPLIAPINIFDAGTYDNKTYDVDVVSNSSITSFSFNSDNHTLSFDAEGEDGTMGFSRVVIPSGLMWCDNLDEWVIMVGGVLTTPATRSEQDNYTYFYFIYGHSKQKVEITSTHAVYLPGDYNHDGIVDMNDVDLVRVAWQSKIGDLNYNPHADSNMDRIINVKDASIIGVNWQKHT